jgi:hypothetical protein
MKKSGNFSSYCRFARAGETYKYDAIVDDLWI